MLTNIWRVGVRRMGPDSFQWCPVTRQGAKGTNRGTGSSIWTWGRISSLWGWQSTGTGCPGRSWNLLLWRYSRPTWTRSCAACCRWPCSSRRVGLDDPQRSLPTPTILWFCDSVILQYIWKHIICLFWNAKNKTLILKQSRCIILPSFKPQALHLRRSSKRKSDLSYWADMLSETFC